MLSMRVSFSVDNERENNVHICTAESIYDISAA